MHTHLLSDWQHGHVFLGVGHDRNERRTWVMVGVTTVMMVGKITAGLMFGTMALLADGIHMAPMPVRSALRPLHMHLLDAMPAAGVSPLERGRSVSWPDSQAR